MSDYDASKVHISWAKEMAAWRHGDAKLVAADVLPSDTYLKFSLFEPTGIGAIMGRPDSYINHWRTKEYSIGFFGESYYMQTGRLLYPFFGVCSTTENVPVGYNTYDYRCVVTGICSPSATSNSANLNTLQVCIVFFILTV